ncbi:MAG: hypothetical protein ACYTGL_14470 [Planctomycetota bacterium]|jgi:hypothetical protein
MSGIGTLDIPRDGLEDWPREAGTMPLNNFWFNAVSAFHERRDAKRLSELIEEFDRWGEISRRFLTHTAILEHNGDTDFAVVATDHLSIMLSEAGSLLREYTRGDVICSVKVPTDSQTLACLYPVQSSNGEDEELAAALSKIKKSIEELTIDHSNAGVAYSSNETIFVPNIKKPETPAIGLPEPLLEQCRAASITGVVVTPVRLSNPDLVKDPDTSGRDTEPVAIFKADLRNGTRLYDTKATRRLLGLVTDFFANIIAHARFAHCMANSEHPNSSSFESNFRNQISG